MRHSKVLIVDDDPDVREYAVAVLEEEGFEVVTAADGAAALRLLERDREIRLLFTDVVMPGLNGFETARLARQYRPDVDVLFASGYATDLTPAGRLLKKPYRPQQLVREVTSLLGDRARRSEGTEPR
jgi:CheY-like chemotaxis protein